MAIIKKKIWLKHLELTMPKKIFLDNQIQEKTPLFWQGFERRRKIKVQ